MIKPNELRIGNKVIALGYDIDPDGNKVSDPDGDFIVDVDVDILKECVQSPHSFKPIPLTREWLERCGYEYSNSDEKWYKSSSLIGPIYFIYEGTYGIQGLGIHPGNRIKYLHQLQNLYFALTGEELTIKEPA